MGTDNQIEIGSISLLIPACKSGEKMARQELFQVLEGYLETVANNNLDQKSRRKAGASDVVQNAFLIIIEKFEQFRGETTGELKTWIKKIVQNEANLVRRQYAAGKRDVHREVSMSAGDSQSAGIDLSDPKPTPSSAALKTEQIKRVHEILKQMAPNDAEVIRLRSIEELAFNEIGERMDRTEQAASQLWYRAILKFEKLLRISGGFGES